MQGHSGKHKLDGVLKLSINVSLEQAESAGKNAKNILRTSPDPTQSVFEYVLGVDEISLIERLHQVHVPYYHVGELGLRPWQFVGQWYPQPTFLDLLA